MKFNRQTTFRRLVSMFLLASLATGCASGGATFSVAECPAPVAGSSEYFIGAGDNLEIIVWRNEELSVTVPVRPDGKVSIPLVDDMQASGKTPSQLARDMESVLSEYLRSPVVSVIVTGQGSANQIQVVGEVVSPQPLSYRDGLRVLDVFIAVGGVTDFAAGNRTKLVRQTEPGQAECRIRVKDLLAGDMSQNINLYPGDVIVVPRTRF
ncbi:MAG: sugar ABC transporter substrate-binding protein [Gammaproteobacteria bacterium]|nr:sugar ABC transporter substrate-binding protein [Gammaproteobacteria bacterium]